MKVKQFYKIVLHYLFLKALKQLNYL